MNVQSGRTSTKIHIGDEMINEVHPLGLCCRYIYAESDDIMGHDGKGKEAHVKDSSLVCIREGIKSWRQGFPRLISILVSLL
jgi:hypothetical protein